MLLATSRAEASQNVVQRYGSTERTHLGEFFTITTHMTTHDDRWPQAVELSGQVQRCHAVIDSSPALQLSCQEQRSLLDRKMAQLKERRYVRTCVRITLTVSSPSLSLAAFSVAIDNWTYSILTELTSVCGT